MHYILAVILLSYLSLQRLDLYILVESALITESSHLTYAQQGPLLTCLDDKGIVAW